MEEVKAALGRLQAVGAGMDNVPPIEFSMHSMHSECAVLQALTLEFNNVVGTGEIPASWQKHRMLIHYKGHNAHLRSIFEIWQSHEVRARAEQSKAYTCLFVTRLPNFVAQDIYMQYIPT